MSLDDLMALDEGEARTTSSARATPGPTTAHAVPIEKNVTGLLHVDVSSFHGKAVPERRWIVDDWIPQGYATLFSGQGGTGKSLVSLQLLASVALGKPWLGMPTTKAKVFGLFSEDDQDELHRRLAAIIDAYGISFLDLKDRLYLTAAGAEDSAGELVDLFLATMHDRMVLTNRFDRLVDTLLFRGVQLVVLDAASHLFGGSEIDRMQVTWFGDQLNRLARRINGAVVLIAHPSRSGLSSGEGTSGSTAWEASARSRFYLSWPKVGTGEERDPTLRILSKMKANYAPADETIELRYQNGLFVPVGGAGNLVDQIAAGKSDQAMETAFLSALDKLKDVGRDVSDAKTGARYAPKVMALMDVTDGIRRHDLEQAMARLFDKSAIKLEPYGPPSRGKKRIVRCQ